MNLKTEFVFLSAVFSKISLIVFTSDIFSCDSYLNVQEVSGKERLNDFVCHEGVSCRYLNKTHSLGLLLCQPNTF